MTSLHTTPSTHPPIAILMATYNGARFLREQLESLWQQTRQDFLLIVRDDGSTDGTVELLRDEAAIRPGRVQLIDDSLGRLGPKASFGALVKHARARWIAFCDQDDQWAIDKLERQIGVLEALEARHGSETPLLCCGDATVTDSILRTTAPSYFAKHDISTAEGRDLALPRLLFRNYAIGATTVINSALAKHCDSMPDEAIMHDWWCALVASISGRTVVLQESLIRYRQHDRNAVGSPHRPLPRTLSELKGLVARAQLNSARCVRQVQALQRTADVHALAMTSSISAVLGEFASFASKSRLQRASTMVRMRSFKPGVALNALHLYACVTAQVRGGVGSQ